MSKSGEFFFDLGSPTTYLAYTQLPTLCAQTTSQLITFLLVFRSQPAIEIVRQFQQSGSSAMLQG